MHRYLLPLILLADVTLGQSNPSWWKYAPPESTALAGLQWKELRATLFAPAIAAELGPEGSFGFPDVELLRTADQILIGSPSLVAVEYGTFPIAKLRAQAEKAGLKRNLFNRAEVYSAGDPAKKSIAYINENLILVGPLVDLQETIDRVGNPKSRAYSPLLARAARYSKEDIWVVSEKLPDPLASLFVPIEVEATAFEGSMSVWDGLHMVAGIERATPIKAMDFADSLAERLATRPFLAEATEINTRDRSVLIRMDLDEMELLSVLKAPAPVDPGPSDPHGVTASSAPPAPTQSKPQSRSFVPPAAKSAPAPAPRQTTLSANIPDAAAPETVAQGSPQVALPPAPPVKKTIRILGLEGGPQEIPLGN